MGGLDNAQRFVVVGAVELWSADQSLGEVLLPQRLAREPRVEFVAESHLLPPMVTPAQDGAASIEEAQLAPSACGFDSTREQWPRVISGLDGAL